MNNPKNKQGATDPESPKGSTKWQENLLPFLQRVVLLLILAFLVVSAIETYTLKKHIYNNNAQSLPESLAALDSLFTKGRQLQSAEAMNWYTRVALEEQALTKRYDQARSVLLFSIYTRFLGFYTGMILALVGTLFVLGKIEDSGSEIEVEGAFGKAMAQGSPGIIMAVLGTVLMLTTIVKEFEIQVTDLPLFVGDQSIVIEEADSVPIIRPPAALSKDGE
ncbi:MAG: hypothetical protein OEV49_03195 [candidate division Zixibacteria bacterium]|nr:hypothetical protein [candidate division Zixibacteria bacterium]MDH3937092.1 hypothetical protein [candidate division Zixibacteria bacterium]